MPLGHRKVALEVAAADPASSAAGPRALRAPSAASRRLRLAYVITRADDLGGAQIHVRDLAARLRAAGHEAAIFAGAGGVLSDQLEDLGVPFHEIPGLSRDSHGGSDLRALSGLRRALRAFRPDLVSAHSSKAGFLARLAARSLGLPVLFTAHGWAFSEGVPRRQQLAARWLERAAAPLARRIILVSEYDRQLALGSRVGAAARLQVVHNGVHDVSAEERARPEGTPVRILMTGRFAEQKDHATLFRALAQLVDREWHLDLVGDGPLRAQVQALAEELGIADRVSFLGRRGDVSALLARAQLYVLISRWEGLPRSIIEAMRAGLPVVASDVGGVTELVQDGVTGCLVPRGDAGVLAAQLRELLRSPELRLLLGKQGRSRYEGGFTFERMFEETFGIYRQVLGMTSS